MRHASGDEPQDLLIVTRLQIREIATDDYDPVGRLLLEAYDAPALSTRRKASSAARISTGGSRPVWPMPSTKTSPPKRRWSRIDPSGVRLHGFEGAVEGVDRGDGITCPVSRPPRPCERSRDEERSRDDEHERYEQIDHEHHSSHGPGSVPADVQFEGSPGGATGTTFPQRPVGTCRAVQAHAQEPGQRLVPPVRCSCLQIGRDVTFPASRCPYS